MLIWKRTAGAVDSVLRPARAETLSKRVLGGCGAFSRTELMGVDATGHAA